MIVWLDDLRDPCDYGLQNAVWCKNYEEWSKYTDLNSRVCDNVLEVHLDHDLGEEQTGYDALVDIECMLILGMWKSLSNVYIHTSNPSAATKMMLAKDSLSRYGVTILRNNY